MECNAHAIRSIEDHCMHLILTTFRTTSCPYSPVVWLFPSDWIGQRWQGTRLNVTFNPTHNQSRVFMLLTGDIVRAANVESHHCMQGSDHITETQTSSQEPCGSILSISCASIVRLLTAHYQEGRHTSPCPYPERSPTISPPTPAPRNGVARALLTVHRCRIRR